MTVPVAELENRLRIQNRAFADLLRFTSQRK